MENIVDIKPKEKIISVKDYTNQVSQIIEEALELSFPEKTIEDLCAITDKLLAESTSIMKKADPKAAKTIAKMISHITILTSSILVIASGASGEDDIDPSIITWN